MPLDAETRGRQASIDGFANEKIACGILMKRYGNVSLVDLPLSSYDIIVVRKMSNDTEDIIRVQSKTAKRGISFVGGSRGGIDRTYKSGVKTYTQSPKHSDCILGIHFRNGEPELYFVPTILVNELNQKSISLGRIQDLKNNYEMFENCKNRKYVISKARRYGIID